MLQNGIPPPLTWPLNTIIIIHMKYWNSSFNSITYKLIPINYYDITTVEPL